MNTNKNILHLDKISEKEKNSISKTDKESMLMLSDGKHSEELSILRAIGADKYIQSVNEIKSKLEEFEVLENKYGGKVYSGEQIKRYCKKYGYRISRVDNFKHKLPIELGTAINEFINKNKEIHERSSGNTIEKSTIDIYERNFLILTSIQAFNGAKIKSATLFYRESYYRDSHDDNDTDKGMLEHKFIEITSWNENFEEANIFPYYLKDITGELVLSLIGILTAILISLIGNDTHWWIFTLFILSCCPILFTTSQKFLLWN